MKRAFLAILLAGLLPSAHAGDLEHCKKVAGMAEIIMDQRQSGVDIVDAYEIAENNSSQAVTDLATMLITKAYDYPLMSLQQNKDRAISEFKSKWMVRCMQNK